MIWTVAQVSCGTDVTLTRLFILVSGYWEMLLRSSRNEQITTQISCTLQL
jgi:hypothetical protein